MLKITSIAAIILMASVSPTLAADRFDLEMSGYDIPVKTIDMDEILEINWGGIKSKDLTSAGDALSLPTDDDEEEEKEDEEVSVPAITMPTFPIN